MLSIVQCTTPQLLDGGQTRISLRVESGDSITTTIGVIQVVDFSTTWESSVTSHPAADTTTIIGTSVNFMSTQSGEVPEITAKTVSKQTISTITPIPIDPDNKRGPNILAIVLGSVGGVILFLLLAAGITVGVIFLRRYMAERAIRARQNSEFEMRDK